MRDWRTEQRARLRHLIFELEVRGPPEHVWNKIEYEIKAYAEALMDERKPRYWVCVADVRGRCNESAPIDSDAHKRCGEFILEEAPKL